MQEFAFGRRGQVGIAEVDGARGGPLQPGEEGEQGGLAGAGGADDRRARARGHVEVDAVEGEDVFSVNLVMVPEVSRSDRFPDRKCCGGHLVALSKP